MKARSFRRGDLVRVTARDWPRRDPHFGTVTQVRTRKACVLFPIRKFVWLPIEILAKVKA